MTSRVLALIVTAAVAFGVAGSASANVVTWDPRGEYASGGLPQLDNPFTYTYGVNARTRTCTLTRGAKCVGARLRGKVKYHGDLRGANLRRADLRLADLRGANLQGADLRGANLKYADLRGANLKGVKFQYAAPVHANTKAKRGNVVPACAPNCAGAYLYGANLQKANLTDANLTGALLSYANLTGANLTGANLYYAFLPGANLTDANLYFADLRGANLTGANLTGANLTDVLLARAVGLASVIWVNTACPNGVVTNTGCPT